MKSWIPRFALACCVTAAAAAAEENPEVFAGLPKSGEPVQVLHNPGFLVGYSDQRRQPLWVAYRAASVRYKRIGPRPPDFSPDSRVEHPVTDRAYAHSGYDRGHLAPNYIIGKLYGQAGQRATFLLTNVSPQTARLDQWLWQRLEEAEADVVAPLAGDLPVLVGPVFSAHPPALKGGVAIPDAFFRIWVDHRGKEPRVLAFIMPQNACGPEPLSQYVVSVREVERRTGLDFFPELGEALENRIEAGKDTEGWEMPRYDRSRGRYADKFAGQACEP